MRAMWGAAAVLAALLLVGGRPEARAESGEVDCGTLKEIAIGNPESYDSIVCIADQFHGRSAGAYDGNVSGRVEVIVAYNRASFGLIQFVSTDRRSFIQAQPLREYIDGSMSSLGPRNWGAERRHARFAVADVQAKVTDDSPYLDCVAFVSWMRPAGGGPGYKEAVSGLYCAMDLLKPTEAEVAEFLDGLEF